MMVRCEENFLRLSGKVVLLLVETTETCHRRLLSCSNSPAIFLLFAILFTPLFIHLSNIKFLVLELKCCCRGKKMNTARFLVLITLVRKASNTHEEL